MKKQYKHKHLEGWVATQFNNELYSLNKSIYTAHIPAQLIEGCDEWKEVKEPVYEIVKKCPIEGTIYQVRRISDNSLWTIGDRIVHSNDNPHEGAFTIDSFQIGVQNDIWANPIGEQGTCNIRYWKKVEPVEERSSIVTRIMSMLERADENEENYELTAQTIVNMIVKDMNKDKDSDESIHAHSEPVVLLTTEDGTRLYKGSTAILYRLNINDWTTDELERCPECISYDTHNYKYWISEEHMKEYIEYNRPMLSQKEIVEEVMPQALIMTSPLAEKLKCALDSYVIEKNQNNK